MTGEWLAKAGAGEYVCSRQGHFIFNQTRQVLMMLFCTPTLAVSKVCRAFDLVIYRKF